MDATGSFLYFELSQRFFAIFVSYVRKVEPMRELIAAPELPAFVEGFLQGAEDRMTLIPVLRLDTLLQLSPPARIPGLHTPLILVGFGADELVEFALLVERIHGIIRVEPNDPEVSVSPADPEDTLNGCVEAVLSLPEGRSVAVLSVTNLLFAEESERLADFSRRQQERKGAFSAPKEVPA